MAGLISLTIEVYGISYKYIINGVRNANSSACRFLERVRGTQSQACSSVSRDSQEKTIKSNSLGILAFCLRSIRKSEKYIDLLHKVRNKLEQKDRQAPPSGIRNGMKSLIWPFSEKETSALADSLHRHLEIYNTASSFSSLCSGIGVGNTGTIRMMLCGE